MQDWSGQADHGASNDYYHPQPAAFMHIPFQDTSNPLMIPIGSHPDYLTHPPLVHHHGHHQALTQITHATMPIMATQQYIPPAAAPKAAEQNSYYGRGFSRYDTNISNPVR